MTTLAGDLSMSDKVDPTPRELLTTLVKHDAAIKGLSGDMAGLKSEVKALDSSVAKGFATLGQELGKLTTANALRPAFDFHKWVATILTLAILFSMVVAGIIYVANAQFSGAIAKQEATNEKFSEKLDQLGERVGWLPTMKRER